MIFQNYEQQKIISMLNEAASESNLIVFNSIIKDIIKRNEEDKNRMITLWKEYSGETPITKLPDTSNPTKPNNKLSHDFRGIIVNQLVGYMFGTPIKYKIESNINSYTESEISEYTKELESFIKFNILKKLDSETATYTSVCGKAYRLMYYTNVIDNEGKDKVEVVVKNIKPWEAIVIKNPTVDEVEYAMIYYKIEEEVNGKNTSRYHIEFYDNKYVYYFIENDKGDFEYDSEFGNPIQIHGFDFVPVIQFVNNNLEIGDFEKVRSLIDGYDKIISSAVNDLETFANAYLAFFGVKPTIESLKEAKQLGAFYVPDSGGDKQADVRFITKEIATNNITDITKIINNDIYRFSSTVDMSDENFSGAAQTGESRKWKLFALEVKAKEKERYYEESIINMLKVLISFWRKVKNIKLNVSDINIVFDRSIPIEYSISDLVQLHNAGLISTETILANIHIVNNVKTEYQKILEEKSGDLAETVKILSDVNSNVNNIS